MTPASVLFRQVHPHFIPAGELSSQAFFPFPKDDGKLSVYDGDQITAEASFQHYTHGLQLSSHSVWGVTSGEVTDVGLSTKADPLEHFLSHAFVDFRGKSEKECRKLAKKLKAFALQRGCLFQPPA
jgi:hypothetical protein